MSKRIITKAPFLTSIDCVTQGWFSMRDSDANLPSAGDLLRMAEGQDIHRRAHALHPDGVFAGTVEKTKRMILNSKVRVVFEAAFEVDGFAARADWIRRVRGGWVIGEVKSSLHNDEGPKPEHIDDLAYTTMVLRRTGLPVKACELILMDRSWRLGMTEASLFIVTDHTDDVLARADEFNLQWDRLGPLLRRRTKPSPHWCMACKACEYFADQCVGVGIQNSIFKLPRLSEKKFNELTAMGVLKVKDIPVDYALTDNQEKVAEAIKTGKPQIDKALIRDRLNELQWPVGFLDFETVKTAIPLYPDIAPHEQLVTQYSLHIQESKDSETEHREYLAEHDRDCREDLAVHLLADTADCRSMVVYSSFEKTVIRGLAARFPKLAARLRELEAKLFDLEPVVRKGLVHPEFGGRSSIKVVLPVLAPDLSYSELGIGDGDSAIAAFARLAAEKIPADQVERIRSELLEYCSLDTFAMVRLMDVLHSNI